MRCEKTVNVQFVVTVALVRRIANMHVWALAKRWFDMVANISQ